MPRYRLTLIDDRTGRPVDTRICHRDDKRTVEDVCAFVLPRVAHLLHIDPIHLRGEIVELVPAMGADTSMAAALTAS